MTTYEPLRPEEAAALLAEVPCRWWVAGGWALDLFLGRETREHEDLDVAVLRPEQDLVYAGLPGWDLRWVGPANTLYPWAGARLELPVHVVWARRSHDEAEPWTFELLLNEEQDGHWLYRRDPRISRPLAEIGGVRDAIPFLRPGVVLLYKSTDLSTKNADDFAAVEPHLSPDERAWLVSALEVCDPSHAWLAVLRS
jgi:aminoglycoside-2''-adenylyltransferase